jgi:hypothetical protein
VPFNSFCRTEKSVVPSLAGATASPSMIADPVQICHASSAIFLNRVVQSTAPGVDLREMDLNAIAIEFDFVEPTVAAGHLVDGARERRFEEVRKGALMPMTAGCFR